MSGNQIIEKVDATTSSLIAKWIRNGFFALACLILNDMRSDIKTGLQAIGALDTRVTVAESKLGDNISALNELTGRVNQIRTLNNRRYESEETQ